jgi:hypothetical protein
VSDALKTRDAYASKNCINKSFNLVKVILFVA